MIVIQPSSPSGKLLRPGRRALCLCLVALLIGCQRTETTRRRSAWSPLHEAVKCGDVLSVARLLARGANVNARATGDPDDDFYGKEDLAFTPLHIAARYGRLTAAQRLLRAGAMVNAQTRGGDTPLHFAVELDSSALALLLIANGADVRAVNGNGETPLHRVERVDVAARLIALGADVNAKNDQKQTPLQTALLNSRPKLASLLIRSGASVTTQDQAGDTPLHQAAKGNHVEVARQLIAKGANINAAHLDGETPLFLATKNASNPATDARIGRDFQEYSQSMNPLHLVELLLARGSNVNASTKSGETPLRWGAMLGDANLTRVLVEHGAKEELPPFDREEYERARAELNTLDKIKAAGDAAIAWLCQLIEAVPDERLEETRAVPWAEGVILECLLVQAPISRGVVIIRHAHLG